MRSDPASFRDPGGHVYQVDGRVFRTVLPPARDHYEFVRSTGCLQSLTDRGLVISAREVPIEQLGHVGVQAPCYVLEHPLLPVISYPFEWSFEGLKAAALLTLDVHLDVLQHGVTLSDASAYNIQFVGPNPLFIDYLSFRRYQDGEFWDGHRQFCEQFLNPLLLTALTGVSYHAWYRGSIEGIPATDFARLIPIRNRLSWKIFSHVILQARYSTPKSTDAAERAVQMKLPLAAFQRMLGSLRSWVSRLEPSAKRRSVWAGYTAREGYEADEKRAKEEFVRDFCSQVRPKLLLDVGCNTGEYTRIALAAGAETAVGLESDHGALDAAFKGALADDLPFLPLHTDVANPTPGGGWRGEERASIDSRIRPDAIMALAVLHHLAIGRNIPLPEVTRWVVSRAPAGIVEFVPKSDPMVRHLLRLREDIFEDYDETVFLDTIRESARIVGSETVSESGRLLVWFERE